MNVTTIDYTFWGFVVNTILVLATCIIAIFAVMQARAANLNAQVLMQGQRPYIAAEAHGNPTNDLADRTAPRVQISLMNKGLTVAYDFVYESWIELLPTTTNDFTPAADHFKSSEPLAMYPNHGPLVINIPITSGLTDAQLSDLRHLRLYACVRIRVTYRDSFTQGRYANFGFYVLANGLGFLPKYNDAN
jgi:hypothetical protein